MDLQRTWFKGLKWDLWNEELSGQIEFKISWCRSVYAHVPGISQKFPLVKFLLKLRILKAESGNFLRILTNLEMWRYGSRRRKIKMDDRNANKTDCVKFKKLNLQSVKLLGFVRHLVVSCKYHFGESNLCWTVDISLFMRKSVSSIHTILPQNTSN